MRRENKYKKLIVRARGKIRASRIPRTLSKKNNNVFSNEKHIIMYLLMQVENKNYREMPDFLELVNRWLKLPKIPHYTTINKFVLRAKPWWFEKLIAEIVKDCKSEIAAIDGTGFSLTRGSRYYGKIAGERREFLQCNACCETKYKLITSVRVRRKRRNENVDVNRLMRKTSKQISIKVYLGDKLYDSEKNHERARGYNARFIAPLKNDVPVHRTNGRFRKKLRREFPEKLYHKRSLIESSFSAIKRKYGGVIYSRKFRSQKIELLTKVLAYDLEKSLNIFNLTIYFLQCPSPLIYEILQNRD